MTETNENNYYYRGRWWSVEEDIAKRLLRKVLFCDYEVTEEQWWESVEIKANSLDSCSWYINGIPGERGTLVITLRRHEQPNWAPVHNPYCPGGIDFFVSESGDRWPPEEEHKKERQND